MSQPTYPSPLDPAELGFEKIVYEKVPPRATITMNRPEVLNAFDFQMLRELARACEDASYDDDIRVVVLTGTGRAFCVGADLKSWADEYLGKPNEYWKWFGAFKDAHDRLREIGKPTLARINGICVGGGNELQMACDLAVMVDDAFIRHVGPEHGSVPAGGATQWLTIMVGDRRAREIVLMCEPVPAEKAAEWGLVNWAVPAAELDAKVDAIVENLERKLPQTTRYAKQHLNFWKDLAWHETINHARDWLALSMATEEPQAAVRRFVEKGDYADTGVTGVTMPLVEPETRYAKSDGVNIAYQVTGEGPPVVLVSGFVSHLELDWDEPRSAYFLDRLSSFCTLVRFDKRGTGLSDRPGGLPDLETRMDDMRAVLDAEGIERAALLGYSEGGPMCVLFAATYPGRTTALVVYGSYAKRQDPDEDYPWAATHDERVAYAADVERAWGEEGDLGKLAPHADEALARWWGARGRAAASPGAARDLILMNSSIDVRDVLPVVRVPALVLHRTGDLDSHVEEGRYIAKRIPGGRFVELAGDDHLPWMNADQILDEVEEFLTGVRRGPAHDRVLATVLFTDVVHSTDRAAELGDRAWRDLLARHDALVTDVVGRYGGTVVDTAGDGLLARFDGPARSVRAAGAIISAMRGLGLEVRAGVHTGEVELTGDGIAGIAVHVGSRISALAQPGQVLVSSTVKDLVAGSGLEFRDNGETELRGVPGTWRLYAAVAP